MTPTSPTPTTGLDAETRKSLSESLTQLFADSATGDEVTAALTEMGWAEVEAEDTAAATSLLFRAQGAALANTTALSDTMIRSFEADLPYAASKVTLALPHPSDDAARPGAQHTSRTRAILLDRPLTDTLVLLPTCHGDRVVLRAVAAEWVLDRCTSVRGFDPASTWLLLDTPDEPPVVAEPVVVDWVSAIGLGRRALAAEILGVCDAALDLAREHVAARHQYGRAIGSFQAVRHRLSEAFVAVESATAVLDASWNDVVGKGSLDTPPEWASVVAKARAGRAQSEVMRTGVQVLGAMGLTLESTMHRHVTRAAALDLLLGGQARLETALGDALLTGTTAYPFASI